MEGDEERMAWESKKGIITVARLQIYVELIPWTTAALVTIRQVGTDVFTAMIHHSTHILSCRVATWREIQLSSTLEFAE